MYKQFIYTTTSNTVINIKETHTVGLTVQNNNLIANLEYQASISTQVINKYLETYTYIFSLDLVYKLNNFSDLTTFP